MPIPAAMPKRIFCPSYLPCCKQRLLDIGEQFRSAPLFDLLIFVCVILVFEQNISHTFP